MIIPEQNDEGALKRVPELSAADRSISGTSVLLDTGLKEAKLLGGNLSAEEIASIQANKEHNRNEAFRDHFENIAICGLWLVSIVMLTAGITWFWHILTPERMHWLTADGVSRLQNILTGGVIAAVAGGHMKRRLS